MAECTLTERQVEALYAAHVATDGWIARGPSRIWARAPMAITALVRKQLLDMHPRQAKARLTDKGRARIEALIAAAPERFGLRRKAVDG